MTIKESLATLVLGGVLAISGCNSDTYLEGEVIKKSGSVINFIESRGALFGNESVQFGNPSYVLRVKTEKGIYTINIEPSYDRPLTALAEAINVGDKVRFRANDESFIHRASFSEDRIGSLLSQDIIRLDE